MPDSDGLATDASNSSWVVANTHMGLYVLHKSGLLEIGADGLCRHRLT